MRKILISLTALLILTTPVYAKNLWEYASFDERSETAANLKLVDQASDYVGDYATNQKLLDYYSNQSGPKSTEYLQVLSNPFTETEYEEGFADIAQPLEEGVFGASAPFRPSSFKTTLSSSLNSTMATSTATVSVSSITTKDNHALTTADIGDFITLTVCTGCANEEKISCTAITGTTFTGCTRGYRYYNATAVSENVKSHGPGETVIISNDDHYLTTQYPTLDGEPTINGLWSFGIYPESSVGADATTSNQFITKQYADNLVNQGAATSSETIAGISELATQQEMASSTWNGLDFPTVLQSRYASSTPSINNVTGRGLFTPISRNNGYLSQLWFDLSENWAFTGLFSASNFESASTTLSGNTLITGNATTTGNFTVGGNLLSGNVPYYGNGSDGALNVTSATVFNASSSTINILSSAAGTTVYVADTSQFTTSTKVFLHQTQGTGAGLWEMITVAGVDGTLGTITSDKALTNSYQSTGGQALVVNQYTTVAFKTGGALNSANQYASSTASNPIRGGIIVMYASEGIIIENDVTLTMDGFGFTGGINALSGIGEQGEGSAGPSGTQSQAANGNGGGGGAEGGVGTGGKSIIDSTSSYFSAGMAMQLGGGGGAGAAANVGGTSRGGRGGGIIIFITPSFINLGTITNDGINGEAGNSSNGSGHGGGAGGVVAIFSEQVYNRVTPTITGGTVGANDGAEYGEVGGGGGNALPGTSTGGVGMIISGYPFGALPGN